MKAPVALSIILGQKVGASSVATAPLWVKMHGGDVGSAGTINVAWSLQAQGIAPDGIIPDASVLNRDHEQAKIDQQVCAGPSDAVARRTFRCASRGLMAPPPATSMW